jgi:hypothetical protein
MIVAGIHSMLALRTGIEELALSDDEAEKLARAAREVASFYAVLGTLSPEAAAWLNLGQTAAFIYGPRVVAGVLRKKNDAREAAEPEIVIPTAGMFHNPPGPQASVLQ